MGELEAVTVDGELVPRDEVTLEECAAVINTEFALMEEDIASAGTRVLRIGKTLIAAKEKKPHGGWIPWVEENCPFGEREAQRYIKITKSSNTTSVSHLPINEAIELINQYADVDAAKKQAKIDARKSRIAKREDEAAKLKSRRYRCIHGDFAGIKPFLAHCIITDPPYGKGALPMYSQLSEFASKTLPENGLCLVMTGQAWLEEVLARLSEHLEYQWTHAYVSPGGSTQVWGRRVKSNWKPVIMLTKGKNTWEHTQDTFYSDAADKEFHDWGQSVSGMISVIDAFSAKNQLVVDPFMGAGTTGVAALLRGRRFVGIEKEKATLDKAAQRLNEIKGK